METVKSFEDRVLARTGVALADIPVVEPEAMLEGQILCTRGGCLVVTVGYPTVDPETSEETYSQFGVIGRDLLLGEP